MSMATTFIRSRGANSSLSWCLRNQCLRQAAHRTTTLLQSRRTLKISYSGPQRPDFAFAFDIDGVLLRGSVPQEGASKSLAFLQKERIPFILLTNGGGKHEKDRAAELSDQLKVPLDTSVLVQSHTPFAELVHGKNGTPAMKDQCVLVIGGEGDNCRKVAESYGFTNVITTADIVTACPNVMPFAAHSKDYYASYARPLPRPVQEDFHYLSDGDRLKVNAILVFNDSRDWALDIQIILDLLLSERGVLGTLSRKNDTEFQPNRGYQQDSQPVLYFSNPDFLWASRFSLLRLGQGAFREALEGIWRVATGGEAKGVELQKRMFGKPHQMAYEFAERRLLENRREMYDLGEGRGADGLKCVYMVGDNCDSDILGANSYNSPHGTRWSSILIRESFGSPVPVTHPPDEIVEMVWDAVKYGLTQSKWSGEY